MSWLTPEVVDIIIAALKAVVILLAVVITGALLSWVERRLLALWQDRYGPNRVGPFGAFQLGADMIKMFFKEDWTPPFADKMIFTMAPVIAMSSLLIAFAVIPITPTWGVADLNIGLLFFFGMAGITVYAVLFAGWASNNKFALLGSLRASAQTLSYEVFMGLALMGVVAQVGSFNLRDIVEYQQQNLWFIIPQFFGFCTFALAGIAVTHRTPFDLPEAESELAAGYHTEYAGMKWAMFFVGENDAGGGVAVNFLRQLFPLGTGSALGNVGVGGDKTGELPVDQERLALNLVGVAIRACALEAVCLEPLRNGCDP